MDWCARRGAKDALQNARSFIFFVQFARSTTCILHVDFCNIIILNVRKNAQRARCACARVALCVRLIARNDRRDNRAFIVREFVSHARVVRVAQFVQLRNAFVIARDRATHARACAFRVDVQFARDVAQRETLRVHCARVARACVVVRVVVVRHDFVVSSCACALCALRV